MSAPVCPHFAGVNLVSAKQKLPVRPRACPDCPASSPDHSPPRKKRVASAQASSPSLNAPWACMTCCKSLCEFHLVEHNEKHTICVNAATGGILCRHCRINLGSLLLSRLDMEPGYRGRLEDFVNEVQGIVRTAAAPQAEPEESAGTAASNGTVPDEEEKEEKKSGLGEGGECDTLKGLNNLGNTCYFNSVMQCLNASKDLVALFLGQDEASQSPSARLPLRKRFKAFFTEMRQPKGRVLSPGTLLDAVRGKCHKFRGMQQQDAHEMLMSILDKLVDEEQKLLKERAKKDRVDMLETAVGAIFGSRLANRVHCSGCEEDYWVFDPCTVYSLPISCRVAAPSRHFRKVTTTGVQRKNGVKRKVERETYLGDKEGKQPEDEKKERTSSESQVEMAPSEKKYRIVDIAGKKYMEPHKPAKGFVSDDQIRTVTDCLSAFFGREVLSEARGNAFACPKCCDKGHGPAPDAIREYFVVRPPKMLMIQLKRFAGGGSGLKKNAKHIEVPLRLSLDDFVLLDFSGDSLGAEIEDVKGINIKDNVTMYNYELYGIVSHSGGMGGGHYVAYVKHAGRWFHASDSRVSETSEKRVMMAEAYIAFYRL